MPEERRTPSVAEVEEVLFGLGQRLSYPPTPNVVPTMEARLAALTVSRTARPAQLLGRRSLALAVLAALIAIVLVLAASPGARQALAGRIGLPGILIKHVPAAPGPPATATAAPTPVTPSPSPAGAGIATAPLPTPVPLASPVASTLGAQLDLGEPTTLAAAQARAGFHVLVPQTLGTPDEVYVAEPPPGGEVTLVYRSRPDLPSTRETGVGALLGQFRGTVQAGLFQKLLGPDSQVVATTVAGQPGYWITGSPHLFLYQDPNGVVRQESIRLAGNTLIWEQGGITFRLESALDEEGALKVAESVR